ncbi:MAG TPA: hypothetical protein VFU21_32245 [Kofleriaceae bacterium]|nr:hypothetical protein [Kofleriaceae bacterium]
MSRTIAITMSSLLAAAAAGGCAGGAGDSCEDCLEDHSADAGPDGDDPQDPVDGPAIEVLATVVRDERADAIRFTASGAPRTFEHAGEPLALGEEDGCPVVYKHAYLLRPDHGAEESPGNPLELRFRVRPAGAEAVDASSGAYRVRAQGASQAMTDWLPAEAEEDVFVAPLDRARIPDLIEAGAPLEIELRGRDLAGREATAVRCVDLRPLAGPLHVGQPEGMPRFSLMYRDPVSRILNGDAAWPVVRLAITNGTGDPAHARLQPSAVAATCSKRWQRWNLIGSISTGAQSCESNPTLCAAADLEPVIDHDEPVVCNPSVGSSASRFDLLVEVDGVEVGACAGCAAQEFRLPARSSALVTLVAIDVPGLQPRAVSEPEETYADQEVSYRTTTSGAGVCPGAADCATMFVTGKVTTRAGCSKTALIDDQLFCTERRTYRTVRALTSVSATFDELRLDVAAVSLKAGGEETAPTGYGGPRRLSGYVWSTNANVPDA